MASPGRDGSRRGLRDGRRWLEPLRKRRRYASGGNRRRTISVATGCAIRALVVACVLTVCPFGSVPLTGQEEAPDVPEGALFLLLPVGARAISLGRAMTAMEGREAVFWNPAGLRAQDGTEIVFYRGDNVAGEGTTVSLVRSQEKWLQLGLSYHLNDVGDQDLTDERGNHIGRLSTRNHLGIATVAGRLGRLAVGANLKVVRFQIECRGASCPDVGSSSSSFAVDVGVSGTPVRSLRLAAMVAHVGGNRRVGETEERERLPGRLRVAAALDVTGLFDAEDAVTGVLAVELQERLADLGNAELYVGSEVAVGREDALAIRAGYVIGDQARAGARVGLGLSYDRVDLSIAKSLATSAVRIGTEPVHVTFSVGF